MKVKITRKLKVRVLCGIAVALTGCIFAGVLYVLWVHGAFLPGWVRWKHVYRAVDLDGDGYFETVTLRNRQLTIGDTGGQSYTSPEDWYISHALVGDVNNDTIPELILITWRRKNFGSSKPYWIENDTTRFTEHIFIVQYADRDIVQIWMSSDIGFRLQEARLDALCDLHLTSTTGKETVWEWQGWGLKLLDENTKSYHEYNDHAVTLLAFGTNTTSDRVLEAAYDSETGKYDFSSIYSNIGEESSEADIASVVQETPLVDNPDLCAAYPNCSSPLTLGDALADAGFDVVAAATDHVSDCGAYGIESTLAFWREAHSDVSLLGIHDSQAEAGTCEYVVKNDVRVALFDCTLANSAQSFGDEAAYHVDTIDDLEAIENGLRAANDEADVSVCFLYTEEEPEGDSADRLEQIQTIAQRLIDAGADVIICTQPDVVRPAEILTTDAGATGTVFYSLGNFVSYQDDPDAVVGAAAQLTFIKRTKKGVTSTFLFSCEMRPTVCHFESDGTTAVYFLDNYTAELALRHFLNTVQRGPITTEGLARVWEMSCTSE